eukprot:Lithocolla_globosa_v1_NODE_2774_length_1872_cov_7.746835.p1 type:complete len:208 gc:universal NODE_2774_length_1872_cov_7.746835:258-881(+)
MSFLPRSEWIKNRRAEINAHLTKAFNISSFSGTIPDPNLTGATLPYKGARQNVRDLCAYMIKSYLADHNNTPPEHGFVFKIASDGTTASRTTDFEILSISLLDSECSLAASGTFTLAVARGKESYDLLNSPFSKSILEINEIKKSKSIVIDDMDYIVDFCLGGDMKFLLIERGLQSVSGSYPCPNQSLNYFRKKLLKLGHSKEQKQT